MFEGSCGASRGQQLDLHYLCSEIVFNPKIGNRWKWMDMTCWIFWGIPQYTLENTQNNLVIAGDTIARERQCFVGELEKMEGNLTLGL